MDPVLYSQGNLILNLLNFLLKSLKSKPLASERVEQHLKWKNHFREEYQNFRGSDSGFDIIVRDVRRLSDYPDRHQTFFESVLGSASAWFRAGIVGVCHDGVMLLLDWRPLVYDVYWRGWRYPTEREGQQSTGVETLALIGVVPFENILGWDEIGDNLYNTPQIYIQYFKLGKPFSQVSFYKEQQEEAIGRSWSMEASLESVEKLSKFKQVPNNYKSSILSRLKVWFREKCKEA